MLNYIFSDHKNHRLEMLVCVGHERPPTRCCSAAIYHYVIKCRRQFIFACNNFNPPQLYLSMDKDAATMLIGGEEWRK